MSTLQENQIYAISLVLLFGFNNFGELDRTVDEYSSKKVNHTQLAFDNGLFGVRIFYKYSGSTIGISFDTTDTGSGIICEAIYPYFPL